MKRVIEYSLLHYDSNLILIIKYFFAPRNVSLEKLVCKQRVIVQPIHLHNKKNTWLAVFSILISFSIASGLDSCTKFSPTLITLLLCIFLHAYNRPVDNCCTHVTCANEPCPIVPRVLYLLLKFYMIYSISVCDQ